MRKNVFGRQFKRDINERKALFKGLLSSLVLHSKIKTTEQKAKAIKGRADRLITYVKKDGTHVRRLLSSYLSAQAIDKVLTDIAPRFNDQTGGYTRIIRLEKRFSDNAQMVLMEWVEGKTAKSEEKTIDTSDKSQDKKSSKEVKINTTKTKKEKK